MLCPQGEFFLPLTCVVIRRLGTISFNRQLLRSAVKPRRNCKVPVKDIVWFEHDNVACQASVAAGPTEVDSPLKRKCLWQRHVEQPILAWGLPDQHPAQLRNDK